MGSGIAQVAALAGYQTIQFDVNGDMLAKSKAGIEKTCSGYFRKESLLRNSRHNVCNALSFLIN